MSRGRRPAGIACADPRGRLTAEEAQQLVHDLGMEALEPYPGTQRKPWTLRCRACHITLTRPLNAHRRSNGCMECNIKRQHDSYRLTQEEAFTLARSVGYEPLEPYPGRSSDPWQVECHKCGRHLQSRAGNMRSGGGCIYCARKRIEPDTAIEKMRQAGFEPLEPYPGSNNPWRCLCVKGQHEVSPRYAQVAYRGFGCVVCSGQVRDLEEAVRVMRENGFEPVADYPGANRPWKARCIECGRDTAPTYSHVLRGNSGCKWCSGMRVDPEFAVEVMIRAGVKPLVPYTSAKTPWESECLKCGRRVTPAWTHIASGRGGCRYCVDFGFRAHKPAMVYVASHEPLRAVKVGIANVDTTNPRLQHHTRNGWDIVGELRVDGEDALRIETEILTWWRKDLGLPHYLTAEQVPQGGYTETVSADAVSAWQVWERVRAWRPR